MLSFEADDGETIHVARSGEGPAIVMLHGWTASHAGWAPVMEYLLHGHTILRWDARGHGGHAPRTATVPTVRRMARDLENLLAHFGLSEATLVGHSMGALTIWEYLRARGSERVGALCFVDQSPRLVTDAQWPHGIYGDFDAARSGAFLRELRTDFAEAVLRLAAHGGNERARRKYDEDSAGWRAVREILRQLPPGPLIAAWESLVAADYRDVLPSIDRPTLLVHGSESNFYSPETARHVQSRIPGAVLDLYEGADHSPHWYEPDRFAASLAALVARRHRA